MKIGLMGQIAILSVAILCLNANISAAELISEFHNLDNNQVPTGWIQEIWFGGPGISDGGFRGNITDGRAMLRRPGEVPEGAIGIQLEYDGNIAYSISGMSHSAGVWYSDGRNFHAGNIMAQYNYGSQIMITISDGTQRYYMAGHPLEYGDYHHIVTFYDGRITYKAIRNIDSYVLCDLDISVPGFELGEITGTYFWVHTTTDNNAWSDNLSVKLLDPPMQDLVCDIKPSSCPNPLNVKSPGENWLLIGGEEEEQAPDATGTMLGKINPNRHKKAVLPVAILGTMDFDVPLIDPATITLNGVPVFRWSYEDVATPVGDDAEECECNDYGPDGYVDLTLKFLRDEIIASLGEVYDGQVIPLTVSGDLIDGTPFEGVDCVVILATDENPLVSVENYPNPFNPTTIISFALNSASDVRMDVYNIMGQRVTTLVDGYRETGEHSVVWDGRDQFGAAVASGMYFYRLETDGYAISKKMVLLK